MDRRALLQWMVATGGLAAFDRLSVRDLAQLGEETHARVADASAEPLSLTAQELRTVAAAAECIIPRTDTPGATDANVAAFIGVMMSDWYPAADAERFRAGLAALDATSRARFGVAYADARAAQQVELAQALDGEVTALRASNGTEANAHWFAMLKYLTVWGFCTSETGMRDVLRSYPRSMRYDGAAPVG